MLHDEFAPRRVPQGDDRFLLESDDALDLVDRATEEGVPIVSVNALPLRTNQSPASDVLVADFSRAVAVGHGCWTDAEAFIRARGEREVLFEVTLGDDPIEAV